MKLAKVTHCEAPRAAQIQGEAPQANADLGWKLLKATQIQGEARQAAQIRGEARQGSADSG